MLAVLVFLLAATDPKEGEALLRKGLLELQANNYAAAKEDLELAAVKDEQNPFVWASLARTYWRLEERPKAFEAAERAAKLGGENPVLAHVLAIFYRGAGDSDRASSFERIFALSKDAGPKAVFSYAESLLKQGDFAHAADALEQGLQSNPNDPQLQLGLGVARYGQRRFDDAIGCFLKTIKSDPSVEQPYIFLAKMLDQAGARLPEITRDFQEWNRQTPDYYLSSLLLAKALASGDAPPEIVESTLRRSIALKDGYWESHYELGLLLAKRRKFSDAAAELARSVELDPAQPMSHYHLSRVYDRLGEKEKAKTEREIHEQLTSPKKN